MGLPLIKDEQIYHYSDYCSWPDDGQYGRPQTLSDVHKAKTALFPELELDLAEIFADE